jgi:hypothetical protein
VAAQDGITQRVRHGYLIDAHIAADMDECGASWILPGRGKEQDVLMDSREPVSLT